VTGSHATATPRLGVLLDFGAASPLSILAAARGLAQIVFLCDRDLPYVAARYDDLAHLATVSDLTGLGPVDTGEVVAGLDLAGIITFSESQLRRTAALASQHGWAFLAPAAAEAVTDKYRQRRLLSAAGVQHTGCRLVRTVADLDAGLAEVGLPAVLKPRSGAASARTCVVADPAEAAAMLDQFRQLDPPGAVSDFVVEEYLTGDPTVAGGRWGDYVSVESVTSHGRPCHVEVTGKFPLAPPLRETGYVVPSTLPESARLRVLDLATAALAALRVQHGATHIEIKLTPAGPRIIEVNGRVGGYVADLIRRATGYDLIRAAITAALGRPCAPPATAASRCAFQYFVTPPMDAVGLNDLGGLETLAQRRGLTVEPVASVGDRLDWRRGTLTYVAILHGSGQDHEDVLRQVDDIDRTLHIIYT
jgi:hypothetical protein